MPPAHIGPYRILQALGEGGMGAVYEALHESIERRVALKVLHPEYARNPDAVSRFFNEARAVNRIEHPNIVQVSEYGRTDDGTVYLVMEFLRGQTLSSRLETLATTDRRMLPSEVVRIGAQLADALTAAHEKGIVHRDLKPGNVMLVPEALSHGGERVKLLDFGIAKLLQSSGGKATQTNALMGTPQYMSPEQCRGAGAVDDRTDVYALGVMLYEMLAGRPPFLAEEALGYLAQHAYQQPPQLSSITDNVPTELLALVHRLLEKDKHARPAMREVRTELLRMMATLSTLGPSATDPVETKAYVRMASYGAHSTLGGAHGQALGAWPRRRKVIFALALLGFVVVVGGSAWHIRSGVRPPNHPSASATQQISPNPAPLVRTESPTRTERGPAIQPTSAPLDSRKVAPGTDAPQHPANRNLLRAGSSTVSAKPAAPRSPPAPPKSSRKFVD